MIQQSIVSALHKIGPMLKQELMSMTTASQSDITKALKNGFIVCAEEFRDITYTASRKGCIKYGLSIRKSRVATNQTYVPTGLYDGADLKQFSGRPGCNDAFDLPSRQFNTLLYRDGRTKNL